MFETNTCTRTGASHLNINTCAILTIVNDVFETIVSPDAVPHDRVTRVTWIVTGQCMFIRAINVIVCTYA